MRQYPDYKWVSSLYFSQGLSYAIIMIVATVMYKNLGVSNEKIAFYTSLLLLPWAIKFLLAPIFEVFATKKQVIVFVQIISAILFGLLALSLSNSYFLVLSLVVLSFVALSGSVYDIASDGLYLDVLTKEKQAYFVGIRTCFYQFARFFCQGGLILLAGFLMEKFPKTESWQISYEILALVVFGLAVYHSWILPSATQESRINLQSIKNAYVETIRAFFKQKFFIYTVLFLLFYNFAEAQLLKVAPLYFLDSVKNGGDQLSTGQVGFLFGVVGAASMLIGAVISGWLVSRFTLKKVIVPATFFVAVINAGYLLITIEHIHSIVFLSVIVMLVQFGFGLGNSAYMSKLLHLSADKPYRMSFYAIVTVLMSFGFIIPGALSGFIQEYLGYQGFFEWTFLVGIVVFLYTFFFNRIEYDES